MIDKNKYGHNTLYVYKSFRNENGKSTSKCVERLGRYDDLKKIHDDPIAWAKAYIDELNKQEPVEVSITYSTNKLKKMLIIYSTVVICFYRKYSMTSN